jgi:hypothetical protein
MIQSLSVIQTIHTTISALVHGFWHPILVMIASQAYLILIKSWNSLTPIFTRQKCQVAKPCSLRTKSVHFGGLSF